MPDTRRFQIVVDCADPERMARFWADALGYALEMPPGGFSTWREYWVSVGIPEAELGADDGFDSIVDPAGRGPRIWFQEVPERKTVKNRLHFDVLVGGGRGVAIEERRERVDEEAARLVDAGARMLRRMDSPDQNHYAVAMADPEGNEFDIV